MASRFLTEQDKNELVNKIPSKTSQLENNSGFLTEHQDLSDYALKEDIPIKTSQLENDSEFLTEHQDLSGYALKESIPTKTSQLENDSNYASKNDLVELSENIIDVKNDIDELDESITELFDEEIESVDNILLTYSGAGYWAVDSYNNSIIVEIGYVFAYEFRIDDLDAEYVLHIRNYADFVDYYITDAYKKVIITGERGTDGTYTDYTITDIPENARFILISTKAQNTATVVKKTLKKNLKNLVFINVEDNENINDPNGNATGPITIDSELSLESENPVQNKVITEEVNRLSEEIVGQNEKISQLERTFTENIEEIAELVGGDA